MGTTVPDLGSASGLKNSTPRTISKPNIKITIEPPTAKDPTSTPNILSNCSPRNTNNNISPPETSVALISRIPPSLSFRLISNGTDPTISITANRVNVTVSSSSNVQRIPTALL